MPPVKKPAQERFIPKVSVQPMGYITPCHVWTGAKCKGGYGVIRIDNKNVSTHKFAYEQIHGKVPNGLELDHLCRIHSCCNPQHLEAVTKSINMKRGIGLGLYNKLKTHCSKGHEFNSENTYLYRNKRQCKTCDRDRKILKRIMKEGY